MAQAVRWGILGAANFAREQMAPAIHAARGADLVALATSDPAKAAGFQAFQPRLRVHPDYDALLADPEIDAVYIPLPNHLHIEWALRAIAAGKHVLVEKPLAMTADAFDAVIAARDASGLVVAEAYMIVHHPQFIRARDLVQGGAIGRLCHVDAAFSYNNADAPDNIRNRPETGGGGLPDIGVYTFGAARFVSGEDPLRVPYADIRFENGVDVFAQVAARFPSFTYGAVVSMRMFNRQEVVFQGDAGLLKLTCPFNANVHDLAQITIETAGGQVRTERFPTANHYVHQVENFCAAVRDGAPYPCPLEFSRGTQAMIDMVFAAAGKGGAQ
ncbi:MAG: Gfo/Idh/MocA family oxidoreductase [Rhodobacterales bacterium]|nr:Gfo/Idh/MocA family oxidoreductase [Rhodobacterales bacterium]NCT13153.1 Gfo/Idh/MocA family oxidoreductase [Rhodobacterales bacterium]